MLSLLPLFLSVGLVSACGKTVTLRLTDLAEVPKLIKAKQRLYFEIPAGAQVKTGYPGADPFTVTVVSEGVPTMAFSKDKVSISAPYFKGAPGVDTDSARFSTLSLSTGAVVTASMLASGHGMDRTLVGAIAASALMSTTFAQCNMVIYVTIPNYVQDSVATKPVGGKQYVAFFSSVDRSPVPQPFKVLGGTCSLGQCGGPSSAGPSGCQCDALCSKKGYKDCCKDFDASCSVTGSGSSASVYNKAGEVEVSFAFTSDKSGTCAGRCGLIALSGKCTCDNACGLRSDCCADKDTRCPATESKATACKCSGRKNEKLPVGQQGGPACDSPDAAGKWCYTDPGVCPDGKASQSMTPAQDWSLAACAAAAPGTGTGGGATGGGGTGGATGGGGTGGGAGGGAAKTCKCSAGLVNADGAGGASCTSKDTDGPTGTLAAWCYTEPGVCTDGKDSRALPGKQYSYTACVGVGAPAPPGGAKPPPPAGWKCAAAVYAARDSCDCNCGPRDPDCGIAGLPTTGCLGGQVCSAAGTCVTPAGPGTGGGGGGGGAVRGASLGCTGPSPPASAGLRRQLTFLPRIVGGIDINPKFKQSHLVSLQTATGFHFCGGSLIADGTWVLSAAHCLQGAAYGQVPPNLGQIVLHRHDLRVPLTAEGATAIKPHQVFNHRGYNAATQDNDIALIKLAAPGGGPMQASQVPANLKGHVIKMDDGSFAKEDQLVTVAGWGALASGGPSPPTAKQVTVQYITNAKCQLKGGQAGQPNQYQGRIKPSMMCAGQKNGAPGKDSCQGDSGGPLTTSCMIGGKPRAVLVGVVSWGFGCALANLPGVYAAVNKFIPWMTDIIKANPNSFNG